MQTTSPAGVTNFGTNVLSALPLAIAGFAGVEMAACTASETGLFPAHFAKLHPVTHVPQYALLFQFVFLSVIAIAADLLSRTGIVPDAYTFLGATGAFIYGLLALACLISLRYTDPELERPFRLGAKGNTSAWVIASFCPAVFGLSAFLCTGLAQKIAGVIFLVSGIPILSILSLAAVI